MPSTIGVLSVGTTAVQLTASTAPVLRGIKLSTPGNHAVYYGSSGVTTGSGFYIGAAGEISPATFAKLSDIYLVSSESTAAVSIEIVDQPGITIGVS